MSKTVQTSEMLKPLMETAIGSVRILVGLDPRKHYREISDFMSLEKVETDTFKKLKDKIPSIPVSVRVMYKQKYWYFRTGKSLTFVEYHKLHKATKNQTKADIQLVYDRICKITGELLKEDRFNLDNLKEKATNRSKETFLDLWQGIIDEKKEKTARAYKDSMRAFKVFAGNKVDFITITPQLINRWIKKMREDGISDSSIGMYLRAIRIPINKCIESGYINQANNPLKGIKIPKGKKRTYDSIDIPTINKLRNADVSDNLKSSVDLWVFSYLNGGMNMADIVDLTYSEHYFNTEGKELKFIRKKTEDTTSDAVEILIPISGEIKSIMDRYAAVPARGQRVFPHLLGYDYDGSEIMKLRRIEQANQKMRKHLHRVCEHLGMAVKVGPSFARHSFKTNAEHKGINNTYIEMAMGHTLPGVQQNYMGAWRYEDRVKYIEMLLTEDMGGINIDNLSPEQLLTLQSLITQKIGGQK